MIDWGVNDIELIALRVYWYQRNRQIMIVTLIDSGEPQHCREATALIVEAHAAVRLKVNVMNRDEISEMVFRLLSKIIQT